MVLSNRLKAASILLSYTFINLLTNRLRCDGYDVAADRIASTWDAVARAKNAEEDYDGL